MLKLDKEKDLLVIIDVINGFVYEGAFASKEAEKLVPKLVPFVEKSLADGVETIHYTDMHTEDSIEFKSYPVHCLKGTNECLPVKGLDRNDIEIIPKNSTNGFFRKNPFDYKKDIYIVGLVTDICVFQYAMTCQKYREEYSLPYKVHVIEELIETFDGEGHNRDEMQAEFIGMMKSSGISFVNL